MSPSLSCRLFLVRLPSYLMGPTQQVSHTFRLRQLIYDAGAQCWPAGPFVMVMHCHQAS